MSANIFDLYKKVDVEDYLTAAIKAGEYIRSREIVTAEGKYWKSGAQDANADGSVGQFYLGNRALYGGAAGIGWFFVQLYDATGDESYLQDAYSAGDYLICSYEKSIARKAGYYAGAAGEGAFLELLYDKSGDEKYRQQSLVIADDIYEAADRDENGIHWDGLYDLVGDAGVVIFWLQLAKKTGDKKYLAYAKEVLDTVLKTKIVFDEESIYWKLLDISVYFSELPKGGVIPNFAHGTAGIVYLLTKYYEATGEKDYLNEAEKGFNFLEKIAVKDEDSAIVPYIYILDEAKPYDVFYLGYCHGPAGDGIAANELYKVTGNEKYLDFFKKLSKALIKAGVPEKRSRGYWNDCLCCGSAGILYHFISASHFDESYLSLAKRTADKTVTDAFKEESGYRWYNAWTRLEPQNVDAHTGLYIGAAGSGSALLALYAKLKNKKITPLYEYEGL